MTPEQAREVVSALNVIVFALGYIMLMLTAIRFKK